MILKQLVCRDFCRPSNGRSLFLAGFFALCSSCAPVVAAEPSLDDARATVKAYSLQMAEVLMSRRAAERYNSPVDSYDIQLQALEDQRYPALKQVVLSENPTIAELDPIEMKFSVPVPGAPGGVVTANAGILVAWHALNLDPINGQFMGYSRGLGPDPTRFDSPNQSLAGSSNWSAFYPYPGDYDCSEEWDISKAPDASTAADWVVEELIRFGEYHNTQSFPNFELYRLGIKWTNPMGSIIVSDEGSGYVSVPTVTISGGGGSGATATATVEAGKVTAITVTSAGSGYTTAPTVTISGGGGTGATASAKSGNGSPSSWNLATLVAARGDAAIRGEIKTAILNLDSGRVVFNFYVLLNNGRLTHMQKVLGVHALKPNSPTGETFFDSEVPYDELLDGDVLAVDGDQEPFFRSQQISADFQEIFTVGQASQIDPQGLGDYATTMRFLALKEVGLDPDGKPLPPDKKGNPPAKRYLKAANRAFSYLRTIGNIDGMNQLKPLYLTDYMIMNQRMQMLDLIADDMLSDKFPTRIVTAAKAKEQVEVAAAVAAALGGAFPAFDSSLRNIASRFRGRGTDPLDLTQPLQTDANLSKEFETVVEEISDALDAAVADQVKPVIDSYVLPFADFPRQFPPRMVFMTPDDRGFFMSWEPSYPVDVQKRSSLTDGGWTTLQSNVANSTYYDTSSPAAPKAFYRLLRSNGGTGQ